MTEQDPDPDDRDAPDDAMVPAEPTSPVPLVAPPVKGLNTVLPVPGMQRVEDLCNPTGVAFLLALFNEQKREVQGLRVDKRDLERDLASSTREIAKLTTDNAILQEQKKLRAKHKVIVPVLMLIAGALLKPPWTGPSALPFGLIVVGALVLFVALFIEYKT